MILVTASSISNRKLPISFYRPFTCNLSALPVKFAGLAISDPSACYESNYAASTLVCSHILAAFRGTESFSSADHQSVRKAVTAEIKYLRTDNKQDSTLSSILADLDCDTRRIILRGKGTAGNG
jgi:hypothetical protein